MRILFSSLRLTGHLRPLFPYAKALQRQGHEVALAAPESARQTVEDAGIGFMPFGHPGDEALVPVWQRASGLSREWASMLVVGDIFAGQNARAALPDLRKIMARWKPDLVVRETAEVAAMVAAAERGIPVAQVAVNNDVAEEWMIDHTRTRVDLLRLSVGLEADDGAAMRAARVFTSFPDALASTAPVASARRAFRVRTDRHVLADTDRPPAWVPKGAEPLIFVSLGTLPGGAGKGMDVYRAALAAVAKLPAQVLLSTGGAPMEPGCLGEIPGNVTVETWVNPKDIYPRAEALLCHGGSGTLLEGLAAGLPMVLTPLTADQPDNAELVENTGAGVMLTEPDAAAIADALMRTLTDPAMRRRAAEISDEIAALPDIDAAVQEMLRDL